MKIKRQKKRLYIISMIIISLFLSFFCNNIYAKSTISPFTKNDTIYKKKENKSISLDTIFDKRTRTISILNTKINIDPFWSPAYIDSVTQRALEKKRQPIKNLQPATVLDYLPFTGKVINSITIVSAQTFDRSENKEKSKVQEIIDEQPKTKPWVIRKSLFFKEGDTVSHMVLMENIKYLRSLPFLYDVKIQLKNTDKNSVDIIIIIQDVYPLAIAPLPVNGFTGLRINSIYSNISGMGHSAAFSVEATSGRVPVMGTSMSYTVYNLLGSFSDLSVGYSQLNTTGTIDTGNYESGVFIDFQRQLYSSEAKVAGGLRLDLKRSLNVDGFSDDLFRDYSYFSLDTWSAYVFDYNASKGKKAYQEWLYNGIHHSVALRYKLTNFIDRADQADLINDPMYNNSRSLIGQYSFFNQENYVTKYLLGFGRTEDISIGQITSFLAGWDYVLDKSRLYVGAETQWQFAINEGFASAYAGGGGFLRNNKFEDIVYSLRGTYFSKLYQVNKYKFRTFIEFDYANCFNPYVYKPLNINGGYGLTMFDDEDLNGYQRLDSKLGLEFYDMFSVYGFDFNPFSVVQFSQLGDTYDFILSQKLYSSIGAGFRIRNENLIFNTIRAGAYYYPVRDEDHPVVVVELIATVDLRFNLSPIKAPSVVEYSNRKYQPLGTSPSIKNR